MLEKGSNPEIAEKAMNTGNKNSVGDKRIL